MTDRFHPRNRNRNRNTRAGSSRGGSCPICYSESNHNCPVSDEVLHAPGVVGVHLPSTISASPDYDCFADWHVNPSRDGKAHATLYIKRNALGRVVSYVITGDNKQKYHGSTKFKPPRCNKYIEISVNDLVSPATENELRSATERIRWSLLFGRSLQKQHATVEQKIQFLLKEGRLIDILNSSSRLYRDGQVDLRISNGVTGYHDMTTSSAVFLGDKDIQGTIVRDMCVTPTDLIWTNTKKLLNCTDVTELEEVKTFLQAQGNVGRKIDTCHHLKGALKDMRRLRVDFPSNMLLTVVNYDDLIDIAIPGGSRRLGETPLECAIRTSEMKGGIVLDINSNLRIKGSSEVHAGCHPDGSVMWELFLHAKTRYYFRAVGSTTGEAADHVVRSGLSESIKEMSISS